MTPRTDPVDPAATARAQVRWIERFVIGFLFATMLIRVALIWNEWGFEDVNAYLGAAHRFREGAPLYPVEIDPDSYRVFRYAPWFAWLWVPLSYLPEAVVKLTWGGILAAASATLLARLALLRRSAAWGLAFLMTPWLLSLVQVGNIQPLVVAMLAFGISRRSGPLWIAIGASLKGVPLVFAVAYVARREWMRLGLAVLGTGILLVPLLVHDLAGYQTDPGRSFSLYYYVSPLAWAVAAGGAVLLAFALAVTRSPYVFLAAAIAVMLLAPRSHVTYATFLLVGLMDGGRDHLRDDARQA